MNTVTAIDTTVKWTDNAGPAGGDLASRRARHLTYWVTVFNHAYMFREWWFRRAAPVITVPANGNNGDNVVLPAGFVNMGFKGGLYNQATGAKLDYVDPQAFRDLTQNQGPSALHTDSPAFYSVEYQDSTTFRPELLLPYNTAALTLVSWHVNEPPTIDESSNSNNLKVIPERWHQLTLVPGVRAIVQESKADARYSSFLNDPGYKEGLRLMCINEKHGKDTPVQFPSFFGGR